MRKITVFIIMMVTLASCVREEGYENTPKGNFEALWKAIDEHYCFLDYKATSIGLDWREVHTRYAKRISDKMSNTQLQEVMTEMLAELRDGHVNLFTSADVSRYWSWYEDYPRNLSTELREQTYLGKDYKIAAGLKYKILDDNVGYVLYESFSDAIGEGNIDDVLYYLRTCNGLIIDLRGNSGGQLSNAERLTSHFINERTLVGYMMHKTGPGHNSFSTPYAEYIEPSKGVKWQKSVVLLTNRQCYSACNTFVRNMRTLSNVTQLGDQTGGGGGLPFTAELPNGWSIRFSASPQLDKDMNHIEFGIMPDVPCSLITSDALMGKDTLIEEARKLINQK